MYTLSFYPMLINVFYCIEVLISSHYVVLSHNIIYLPVGIVISIVRKFYEINK